MLNGTPVVDVHHHFLPRAVFDRLKDQAGGARRLVNDVISITLTDHLHDVDEHLRTMQQGGVDLAILTYSGVSVLGSDICRLLNEGMALVESQARGTLYGSVHVSLADDNAAREIERGARELGLRAVALPTSEPGIALDAPRLRPLWHAIAEHRLPVILHPALLPQGATTDYSLERACARPFDTTIAAARIAYGVLPHVPDLPPVVLPHVGGTTVFLRGRLAMFFEPTNMDYESPQKGLAKTLREQQALGLDAAFERAWDRFYYDTAGTGGWSPAVEMAANVVGPGRLMFGTDYPLESHSGATVGELVELVKTLPLPDEDRRAIAGETALTLFGFPR